MSVPKGGRYSSAFVAAAAYAPPPPGMGYLLRRKAPRQSGRRISEGPFRQFIQAVQDPDNGDLYIAAAPDRVRLVTTPLPPPEALPIRHRPHPEVVLPPPVRLPTSAVGQSVEDEFLNALNDPLRDSGVPTRLALMSPGTVPYWRRRYPKADLRTAGGQVFIGGPPSDHPPDPLNGDEVHAYITRNCPVSHIPPGLEVEIDLAGSRFSRYVTLTLPLSDLHLRFLHRYGRFAIASPEALGSLRDATAEFYTPFPVYPEPIRPEENAHAD